MPDDYSTTDEHSDERSAERASFKDSAGRRRIPPEVMANLRMNHPELRLAHDPSVQALIDMMMVDPQDQDVQEVLTSIIDQKNAEYLASGDVFWGNYPEPGSIVYPDDFITLAHMPTNDPVGGTVSQTTCGTVFSGPTGCGKTSLLSKMISNPLLLTRARVIAFTRKRELRHLATIPEIAHLVLTFQLEDLELSFYHHPPGVPDMAWNNDLSRTTGQSYGIFTAHRIMNEKGAELLENHPEGVYPTLRQQVEFLEKYRPRDYMRDAQLKTSIVGCLTDLLNCTGSIWDYSSSNFLEVLFSTPGLAIIEAPALPQQHLTFLATYMMRWAYMWRVHHG